MSSYPRDTIVPPGHADEAERAVRRDVRLSGAQLTLIGSGIIAWQGAMRCRLLPEGQENPLAMETTDLLQNHIRAESGRLLWGAGSTMDAVPLSLRELYLIFDGLEIYERDLLADKTKPLGEVRALIETLRCEMIQREMGLGEIQAALDLTPLGKAIVARVPPEQGW